MACPRGSFERVDARIFQPGEQVGQPSESLLRRRRTREFVYRGRLRPSMNVLSPSVTGAAGGIGDSTCQPLAVMDYDARGKNRTALSATLRVRLMWFSIMSVSDAVWPGLTRVLPRTRALAEVLLLHADQIPSSGGTRTCPRRMPH